jgi:DeoR family suf operon transcriptional repressor
MGSLLQQQWQRKAQEYQAQMGSGSLAERLERLVQLRQAEGYMAEYYPYPNHLAAPRPAEGSEQYVEQYVLVEHHCAIAQIAQRFPSVCGHELEMFAAALPEKLSGGAPQLAS